ncbi:MAG TPA: arginine repressor [Vicinamibacterales bacterium]|nr:arginine repressor [Vicinamibacterales bacterium]
MKSWRQSQILEVIDQEAVASQEELRQRLATRGIEATQATISRDLKNLGLVKRAGDGAYVRPGVERSSPVTEEHLRRAVAALVRNIERVGNLVVVRTDPGQAQGVAVLLDRAQVAEVAGTIAGDDTILIICRAEKAASELEGRWNEVVKA